MSTSATGSGSEDARFREIVRLMLIGVGIVALALAAWQLSHLILLIFGAILVGVILRAAAEPIRNHTPLGENLSLAAAGFLILVAVAIFLAVLGVQIRAQLIELFDRLPGLIEEAGNVLGVGNFEEKLSDRARDAAAEGGIVTQVADYSTWLFGALTEFLLVVIAGIYLAARPQLYERGLLLLVPRGGREEIGEALRDCGRALRLWLLGQLVAMVLVGLLTTLGLWWLGIPSALALGFIAGLLEFVPIVGPILAAVPAITVGLVEGPTTALWVTGLYVLIQQIEGNLITPLVQRRMVDLPPVITIFAIGAFGILFGPVGVLLATPLAVVAFVLVKKLWVRDTLGEETDVPGEEETA